MTRAAVYARVSQDKSGEAVNVGEQRERCLARCAERGWTVVGIHEDNGRSAWKAGGKRPAFTAIMAEVVAGDVDVVVVDRLDRLTRDPGDDWGVQQALGAAGATLEVVSGGGTLDPARVDDRFLQGITSWMGWRESAEKAKRLKLKEHTKAQNGDHHGRRGFGHNHDRTAVIPAEAALIVEAANRVIAGEKIPAIVRDWNERGILTASVAGGCPCNACEAERAHRGDPPAPVGGRWYPTTLTQVLQQPRLTGARTHHGTVTVPDAFAAILDVDSFDRVQAIIAPATRPTQHRSPRNRVLGGFLYCGKCGTKMRSGFGAKVADGTRPPRFACPTKAAGGCGSMAVFDHNAEPVVVDALVEYLASPDFVADVARHEAAAGEVDVDAVTAELRRTRARLVELGDMLAAGELDRAEYKRLRTKVEADVQRLEHDLATTSPAGPAVAIDTHDLRARWDVMSFGERRTILEAVLDRVIVNPSPTRGGPFVPSRLEIRWRWAKDEG